MAASASARDPRRLEALVDEIVMLIRSQMAAVFGNLLAVAPSHLRRRRAPPPPPTLDLPGTWQE